MFGLGSWDENCRCDMEVEPVELLLTNDVLNGLMLQAAHDQVLIERLLAGGQLPIRVGQEGRARDLQHVQQEEFSVAAGCGAKVLVFGKLRDGGGEGLA